MEKSKEIFNDRDVLSYTEAADIVSKIEAVSRSSNPDFDFLYTELIESAAKYMKRRTEWLNLSNEEKLEKDAARTNAHNVFINNCDLINKKMQDLGLDNSWWEQLHSDRKKIGDFACWVACIMAIRER